MEIARDLGDYDELYLNFWYFVDEDVDDEEGLKVEISLNSGSTWDEIFYWYEDNGNSHTWEELRNYDISEYAGSSFNLRFTAISSASSEDMMLANFALRGILGDTGGGGSSNNAPTISITSPSIGSEFDEGDSITFTASATDDNDSDINSNISWSSNHDGALGTGSSINTSSLSVNTHTITASVTDSGGLSDSAEIAIIVLVVDSDGDGIYDVVDLQPSVYSNDFADDNITYGSIVTRGDQTLTIQDEDDIELGVIITSDAAGGSTQAEISVCGDVTTLFLDADESVSVTCGSSTIQVYQGSADVIFYGENGEAAYATLTTNDEILFDPVTFEFTNSGANSVTVTVNLQDYEIPNDNVSVVIEPPDIIPPALTVPVDVTFEATAILTPLDEIDFGVATAIDDVDGIIIPTNNSTDLFPLGNTTITWNAIDSSENFVNATQIITIEDRTIPTIIVPVDATVEATAVNTPQSDISLGNVTATDIFGTIITDDIPDTFSLGNTTITYTVTDGNGLTNNATQIVTIEDTTNPSLSIPVDITAEATGVNTIVDIGNATATDIFSVVINNDAPTTFLLGNTTITWTAIDANNNTNTATQIITIVDTTQPIITLNPPNPQTIELGDGYSELGATTDDGSEITIDDSAFVDAIDSYSILYDSVDAAGNDAAQVIRTVNVVSTLSTTSDAPTSLTATSGNSQVSLSWIAPSDDGGDTITDYLVEYGTNSTSLDTFADGTSNATTAIVTSLTNDQTYYFSVSAINSIGTGNSSSLATATPTLGFVDSFSVLNQTSLPTSVEFSTNGTKMFVTSLIDGDIHEYSCTTPFDVSTCSFTDSFSIVAQDTKPTSLAFSTNGTEMFVAGADNDSVYQYTLTTSFDVTTANFTSSFSVAAQDGGPRGLEFNDDGTAMFVVGNKNASVYHYSLDTAYDVSTASFVDEFAYGGSGPLRPTGLAFSSDGMEMFISHNVHNSIFHFTLTTSFDVSTAVLVDGYSVSSEETSPRDITFSSDGTKMFLVGFGSDAVNEYNLSSAYSFD